MATGSLNFKLQDKSGKVFSLDSFKGMKKVVYFYPKDDTPGCTIETKGFDSYLPKFISTKTAVIGISGGDNKSKEKFCKKYKLKLPLLSDPNNKVAKAYGAFGDKVFMGRKFKGILRNTYILDEKNKLIKKFEKVSPDGHAAEVLDFISGKGVVVTKAAAKKAPASKQAKKTVKKTKTATAKKAVGTGKAAKKTVKKATPKTAASKRAAAKKVVAKKAATKKAVTKKAVTKKAKRKTAPKKTAK